MTPPEIGLHVCIFQGRKVRIIAGFYKGIQDPKNSHFDGKYPQSPFMKRYVCLCEPPLTVPPPPWARMLPRSPAPSSVRSSRSSMGTRALSVWTGLATTTHPRPKGRGSAAAVSSQTPGLLSCETSERPRLRASESL